MNTASKPQKRQAALYIVATPIGNLDDITARALKTLQEVDLVVAEDTRHSSRLLSHYGIRQKLLSCHGHNESKRLETVLESLRAGKQVALVSDAGTPLVSDPGRLLVNAARDSGFPVIPIPGPSAPIAALSVAGLPAASFVFEGFLPAAPGERHNRLTELRRERRTLVFFAPPHRLSDTLQDLAETFGSDRRIVILRELTKLFESTYAGSAAELAQRVATEKEMIKGEAVIVCAGFAGRATTTSVGEDRILAVLKAELDPARAARIAAKLTGRKKREIYQQFLDSEN